MSSCRYLNKISIYQRKFDLGFGGLGLYNPDLHFSIKGVGQCFIQWYMYYYGNITFCTADRKIRIVSIKLRDRTLSM